MKVLHVVDPFLSISENWIYPQVAKVPGVTPLVLSTYTTNIECFPLPPSSLIIRSRPSSTPHFAMRMLRAAATRLGWYDFATLRRVRAARPDLIHCHFGPQSWENLRLRRRLGVPLISSFYGYDAWLLPTSEPIWRSRYARLFQEGSLFLVEGPAMAARLIEIGCPPEKVKVQRIGVDLAHMRYVRRDFDGRLRVVMVGRFVAKKGFAYGIRACAAAVSKGLDLAVTIVGDASPNDAASQKIKEELTQLATDPALSGRISFAGFRPLLETQAILSSHHILLSPSHHSGDGDAEGGSPVVLTEAMARGLLCIGTRHCDIPEVIKDGKTGYLCDEGDTESLTSVLLKLPGQVHLLPDMTRAGREHIERCFSLSAQVDGLLGHYRTLANPG